MAQSEDADGEGTFSLFTSIAYIPDASAFDSSSFPSHFPRFSPLESSSSPFILLDRHQARLANAHEAFAERGGTWCSKDGSLPSPEDLEGELWKCVRQYGEEKPQRVRLEVGPDGPRTTSFELVTMPESEIFSLCPMFWSVLKWIVSQRLRSSFWTIDLRITPTTHSCVTRLPGGRLMR